MDKIILELDDKEPVTYEEEEAQIIKVPFETVNSLVNKAMGEKLRYFRILKGIKLKDLSKMLHISQQQIAKYEKGTNSISPARIAVISHVLGVSTLDFYKDLVPYASTNNLKTPVIIENQLILTDLCSHWDELPSNVQRSFHSLLKLLVEKKKVA